MPPSNAEEPNPQWAFYESAGLCFTGRNVRPPEERPKPAIPEWVENLLLRWSRKKVVLVVEDEPEIRELFALALGQAGYAVETASDGREGLQRAKSLRPDLILLNYIMPYMHGLETLQRIKANPLLSHLKVIFYSATAEVEDDALEAGAMQFLNTPFDLKDMLSVITQALGE